MVLILLVCIAMLAKAQDMGHCTLPSVIKEKDCPAVGYDCHRESSVLGDFDIGGNSNTVSLRCNNGKLFVNGTAPRRMRCAKTTGQWTYKGGPQPTQSALCALSCTSCSTLIPLYFNGRATQITLLPATSSNPCAIGYCNGQGLTLTGMNNANDATAIEGNLTCSGDGWMDSNGKTYANAVCQYYACPSPSPLAFLRAGMSGAVPVRSSGPVLSCPSGYLLFYGAIRRYTRYSLVCGPNGLWQYFGIDIDSSGMNVVFCAPALKTCRRRITSPRDCSKGTCTAPSQQDVSLANGISTTFLSCNNPDYILDGTPKYGSTKPIDGDVMCTGTLLTSTTDGDLTNVACRKLDTCTPAIVSDISSSVCSQNPSQCSPIVASASSLTCPPDQTVIAMVGNKAFAINGNLTCSGDNAYVDTIDRFATSFPVANATCSSDPNLSCRVPPSVLAPDGFLFEYPPGATTTPVTLVAAVFFGNAGRALALTTLTQSSVIYYNDDFDNIVDMLTCIDGKYQTSDGTVVTSAASFIFVNCAVPTKAPGSTNVSQTTSGDGYYSCPSTVVYALDAASPPQTIGIAGITNYVVCGPNKQYVLHDSSGNPFLVPAGTLIGCTST